MPSRKAAKTAVNEAAVFDFDAFLGDFERPTFTRQLMRKAGLLPELTERSRVLDELDKRIDMLERAEGEDKERAITDVSPLAELQARREKLTLEYNDLANEYNASAVDFTFRVPDQEGDKERIEALLDAAGLKPPPRPDESLEGDEKDAAIKVWESDFEAWWAAATLRSMSVTCTSHDFTVEQWQALEKRVGLLAFGALRNAWAEAVQAATPTAPFLLRPLHTPEPGES